MPVRAMTRIAGARARNASPYVAAPRRRRRPGRRRRTDRRRWPGRGSCTRRQRTRRTRGGRDARTRRAAASSPSGGPGRRTTREARLGQAPDTGLDREQPARIDLVGVARVGPAAADRRDEQRREVVATERGHRRLDDRHADRAVDRARRRDPQDRRAEHARDPVPAGLVDARPIRPAGQRTEVEEHPLVGGCAVIDVVVVGPDRLAVGVGEVHRPPVRREGEPVGHADRRPNRVRRPVARDPVEAPGRLAGRGRIEHRPDPESSGRIAAPVIEPIADALRLEGDPVAPGPGLPIEEREPALHGDEQPAGDRRQGQRTWSTRRRPLVVEPGGRVEAVHGLGVDVDPIEPSVIRAPDRALAELGGGREDTRRHEVVRGRVVHAGVPGSPRRNATLSTASAFGPLPVAGAAFSDTSCSRTYQPR